MANSSILYKTTLVLECLEDRVTPAQIAWTNAGMDHLYSNSNNWVDVADDDRHVVPSANDEAILRSSDNEDVIVDGSYTVGKLTVSNGYTRTIDLNGGNLTVANGGSMVNGLLLGGDLQISAGTDPFRWLGGTMESRVWIENGAQFHIGPTPANGATAKVLSGGGEDGGIYNSGTVSWEAANNTFDMSLNATIQNYSGGVFDFLGDGGIYEIQSSDETGSFEIDAGAQYKTSTTRMYAFFENNGSVLTEFGKTFEIHNGSTSTGNYYSDGEIQYHLDVNKSNVISGSVFAHLKFPPQGGDISISSAQMGGELVIDGYVVSDLAVTQRENTVLSGDGTFEARSQYFWFGGTWDGLGEVIVPAGGTLILTVGVMGGSDYVISNGWKLSNYGMVDWQMGAGDMIIDSPTDPTIIENHGNFTINADILSIFGSQSAYFYNDGDVSVQAGAGVADLVFENWDTVAFVGDLTVTGAYAQRFGQTDLMGHALTAWIELFDGELVGPGTINGDLFNTSGNIRFGSAPSGTITINGNYTQSFGQTALTLSGAPATNQFTRVAVSGHATLGGSLNVSLANGYVPAAGHQFDVVTWGSLEQGTDFDDVQIPPNMRRIPNAGSYRIGRNQAPIAADDTYEVARNQTLNEAPPGLLANDTDAEGDPLAVSAVEGNSLNVGNPITLASGATLTVYTDGGFDYTPATEFVGIDSFTYEVSDGFDTDVATVSIDVLNESPIADDDYYSTPHDTPIYEIAPGLLGNDWDDDGDPLTVSAVEGSAANVGSSITLASGATLTVYAEGGFDYTPAPGFVGLDSFAYEISDGFDTDDATVTIDVTNYAPMADDDYYYTLEDVSYSEIAPGVLGNDWDDDGDTLTATLDIGPANGVVTLNSDGSFIYTPNTGFVGMDSFTYYASDGIDSSLATVYITVDPEEEPPIEEATVGDFVWLDANGNGIQDGGETGLAGVLVELLDDTGLVIDSYVTDSTGYYSFLVAADNMYQLRFSQPLGYDFTAQYAGSDPAADSDVDATGLTAFFSLYAGEFRDDIDAGFIAD